LKSDKVIRGWRRTWEERRLVVIVAALLAWLFVITVLHVRLNHRGRYVAGATPAAAVEVGGLPVT
jgi:hypothetical protein